MSDEQGFTLVELLAAMVAASLLLGVLGWAVASLGHQLERSGARAGDTIADLAPVLQAMLEGAAADRTPQRRFEGTADGLTAIVPPPQALGPVGSLRLRLEVRRSRAGEALLASFKALSDQAVLPEALSEPHVLVDGFKAIELDYNRRDPVEGLSTPRLITITFVDDGDKQSSIAIEPRLTGSATCRFDPISMTCQR